MNSAAKPPAKTTLVGIGNHHFVMKLPEQEPHTHLISLCLLQGANKTECEALEKRFVDFAYSTGTTAKERLGELSALVEKRTAENLACAPTLAARAAEVPHPIGSDRNNSRRLS